MPIQIKATSLAESLFVVGVCIGTLTPRLANDRPCSIGGNLSYCFRLLLLMLTLMNVSRALIFSDAGFVASDKDTPIADTVYFVMNASEAFGRSFLCLLTPYLIKETVKAKITPRPMMPWLWAVLVLQVVGMSLTRIHHSPKFWCIKRLGDILSGIPVVTSINEYNTAHLQKKRGTIVFQTIKTMEYLNMAATCLSLVGYFMATQSLGAAFYSEQNWIEAVSVAFRLIGIFANWVRVFCHGMLLNTIDESECHLKRVPRSDDGNYTPPDSAEDSFDDMDPVEIHLLSESRQMVRRTSTVSCSP